MRLINTETLELSTFPTANDPIPTYAILSHTWGEEEVSFQHFEHPDRASRKGFCKIVACCEQTKMDGLEWAWVDTCCIDKTDSVELSEAINSMYGWYRDAAVCYAYLDDIDPGNGAIMEPILCTARWFTRGWCLQELIAPGCVEFYSKDWRNIGTKWSLQREITNITGIPKDVLLRRKVEEYPVAQIMSWASKRKTTRVEDMAYSLLGLFGINMPLLYGEGKKAFIRLQREILAHNEDTSFLLWTTSAPIYWETAYLSVLAPGPEFFDRQGLAIGGSGRCAYEDSKLLSIDDEAVGQELIRSWRTRKPPQFTSRGLRVNMLLASPERNGLFNSLHLWTGFCYHGRYICILISPRTRPDGVAIYDRVMEHSIFLRDVSTIFSLRDIYLTANGATDLDASQPIPRAVRRPAYVNVELSLVSKTDWSLRLLSCQGNDRELVPERDLGKAMDGQTSSKLYFTEVDDWAQLFLRFMHVKSITTFFIVRAYIISCSCEIYSRDSGLSDLHISPSEESSPNKLYGFEAEAGMKKSAETVLPTPVTDRASLVNPQNGHVIVAAIKRFQNGQGNGGQRRIIIQVTDYGQSQNST